MVLVHMPSTRTYGTDVVPTRLLKARLTIALVETLTREVIVTGEEFLLKVEMIVKIWRRTVHSRAVFYN